MHSDLCELVLVRSVARSRAKNTTQNHLRPFNHNRWFNWNWKVGLLVRTTEPAKL